MLPTFIPVKIKEIQDSLLFSAMTDALPKYSMFDGRFLKNSPRNTSSYQFIALFTFNIFTSLDFVDQIQLFPLN